MACDKEHSHPRGCCRRSPPPPSVQTLQLASDCSSARARARAHFFGQISHINPREDRDLACHHLVLARQFPPPLLLLPLLLLLLLLRVIARHCILPFWIPSYACDQPCLLRSPCPDSDSNPAPHLLFSCAAPAGDIIFTLDRGLPVLSLFFLSHYARSSSDFDPEPVQYSPRLALLFVKHALSPIAPGLVILHSRRHSFLSLCRPQQ